MERDVHPFRFGLEATSATSARDWASLARETEDLGFSTLHVSDHLGDQLAVVPALMAAAAATSSLRVGALVMANDFRHPAIVAKEATTIDVLSDGRYELGLGAGWMRSDYDETSIPYEPTRERVDRFEEGLTIVSALLRGEEVTHHGAHYTLTRHSCHPHAVQNHLPVLVGGGGRRMLSIAGRHADIVSINFDLRAGALSAGMWQNGTPGATRQKVAWVRDAAGPRAPEIELHIDVVAVVTDDRANSIELLSKELGCDSTLLTDTPHVVVGSSAQIVDDLVERRETYGFSYITFMAEVRHQVARIVGRLSGT